MILEDALSGLINILNPHTTKMYFVLALVVTQDQKNHILVLTGFRIAPQPVPEFKETI